MFGWLGTDARRERYAGGVRSPSGAGESSPRRLGCRSASARSYSTAVRVGIVGSGPAGLVLGNLLQEAGIATVIVERQSRRHCETRVRAGLLEEPTVALLRRHGWADRLLAQGLEHRGTELRYLGRRIRLDYADLVGRTMHVYPQQEVVTDLIAAYLDQGGELHFDVDDAAVHGIETDRPELRFGGTSIACDLIAGCDGYHGITRTLVLDAPGAHAIERDHEFGWVAMLAEAPPSTDEIIYAIGPDGFAGHMLRTSTVSRYYVQCAPGDSIDQWSDDRIWAGLQRGLASDGWTLTEGPVIEKSIIDMRSSVVSTMRRGQLFLVGDSAHIVPPVGAKGLNLAVADAVVLFDAIRRSLHDGDSSGYDTYSSRCLERVWRIQDFSMWMAWMLHTLPKEHPDHRYTLERSHAQLRYLESSRAYQTYFAENYVGFPHAVEV
jgi:p-hydroxybenzoate 3-monooxygenase